MAAAAFGGFIIHETIRILGCEYDSNAHLSDTLRLVVLNLLASNVAPLYEDKL